MRRPQKGHWALTSALAAGLVAAVAHGQDAESAESSGALGWIELEPGEGSVTIRARVAAVESTAGRTTLEIEKQGSGGTARTRQGGAFDLEKGADKTLGESRISFAPGDDLRVTLTVEVDGKTVSSAEITHGSE